MSSRRNRISGIVALVGLSSVACGGSKPADGGYAWEFVPVVAGAFSDSGSGTCH